MATVEKSVLVGFSAEKMYELVERIEDYPQFLPWCGGTVVGGRSPGRTVGTIRIDYHGIKQSFTTENDNDAPRQIRMRLVDGPFRKLDGTWEFLALGQLGCRIDFRLHYEFSSRIIEKLVGPVFNHIANTLVEAFVKRAEVLKKTG
jgi:ribosome-associated toxin RatA of RatAB toxin-antitoxin module